MMRFIQSIAANAEHSCLRKQMVVFCEVDSEERMHDATTSFNAATDRKILDNNNLSNESLEVV